MAERKILLLSDSLDVREEVRSYVVELAERLEAALEVLVLLPSDCSATTPPSGHTARKSGTPPCDGGIRDLEELFQKDRTTKVKVTGMIRRGDQASELLKVLAAHPPFEAVIWGGNARFLRERYTPVRSHWLERVRLQLGCPLVVPSLRRSRPPQSGDHGSGPGCG